MPGQGVFARNLTLRSHFGEDRSDLALETLWFSLWRGNPAAGGVEPNNTGGYTRVSKPNDETLWGVLGSYEVSVSNRGTAGAVVWPASTALYSITAPLNYWAIHSDASVSGTLCYWGVLTVPIIVDTVGDIPRIPTGALSIAQPE